MTKVQEKAAQAFSALKETMGYTNPEAAPRLEKVVVSVSTGSITDANKVELIKDRLTRITGQKPAPRPARKSIASFKVREGDVIGFQVTLRGKRMYDFMEKMVSVALPRMRDFRGISARAIDDVGNLTIGISEHTVFPETPDEEIKDVFGLSVTLVTTARTPEEARGFLSYLGIPFAEGASGSQS